MGALFSRIIVFVVAAILFAGASEGKHKFYISKSIIEFNPRTQLFEITCKLFTDDLELTMEKSTGKALHLGMDNQSQDSNALLESYMKEHFQFVIDGAPAEWRWVGKEVENDLTYCYMELYRKPEFSSWILTNDLLIAYFPEQQNIVDLTMMGSTQTQVFFKDRIRQTFYR
jgi:hypothetical protein